MSRIDIIYLILLLSSIPLGHVVKNLRSSTSRQFLAFAAGLSIVLFTAGLEGAWHSALTIFGNYLLVRVVGTRKCHIVSFAYVFGYLFFFRTCTWYGLPQPPSHCNAIQLLVTLRMVGLAFEIHDKHSKGDNNEHASNPGSETFNPKDLPSLYDFYSYGYCYCGLMTGPYYTYRTYCDMLVQDTSNISTIVPAIRALKYFPLIAVPYLVLHHYFPLSYLATDEYLEHKSGLFYRLFHLFPCFTWFRIRFYLGWMLAKSMCITMALGAYPFETEPKSGAGPTKAIDNSKTTAENDALTKMKHDGDTHSFETIHNIDMFDVEFCNCVKTIMKAWNKTVQWWLYKYVHQNIPIKAMRMTIVLFVSAFWHGVHPGYYVTFMSVPLLALADGGMRRAIAPYLNERQRYVYDWINWFLLYRMMEYLGVGFMMLKIDVIWKIFKSVYFAGHVFLVVLIVVAALIPKKKLNYQHERRDITKTN
eukprot:gene9066-10034_t